jgi:hypothetical protein
MPSDRIISVPDQETNCMTDHRFELGENVIYVEKRFPNLVRVTDLVVTEQLASTGELHYRLQDPDGRAYVLAECEISPSATPYATRLAAIARGEPAWGRSPWAA